MFAFLTNSQPVLLLLVQKADGKSEPLTWITASGMSPCQGLSSLPSQGSTVHPSWSSASSSTFSGCGAGALPHSLPALALALTTQPRGLACHLPGQVGPEPPHLPAPHPSPLGGKPSDVTLLCSGLYSAPEAASVLIAWHTVAQKPFVEGVTGGVQLPFSCRDKEHLKSWV